MFFSSMSRSPSPSSSRSSSPLCLDPSTLALLDSFLSSKAEEEERFAELSASNADGGDDKPMMSVDEYRLAFGENWQLSQFWCV